MTAVVEHWDGRYELIEFTQFVQQYPMAREVPEDSPEELVAK